MLKCLPERVRFQSFVYHSFKSQASLNAFLCLFDFIHRFFFFFFFIALHFHYITLLTILLMTSDVTYNTTDYVTLITILLMT